MVSAPIDRVRVYRQGATVVRRITLSAPSDGVEVPGLPLSLADATVQLRSLTPGVVAGAVRIGLHAKAPEQMPDTPDEATLREVERRIETIDHTLTALDDEIELMRDLEVPDRPVGKEGKAPPASPMKARVALDEFADSAIAERLDEARELRRERTRLLEEAAALRDAIQRASSAQQVHRHQITKTVLCDLRGTADAVELELEYHVPGARWAPQYRCDIAPDGSEAKIELRALVCQASGEDWRNVALELSTAAPMQFTELPKLASIRIGKAQPEPPSRGYRPPPRGSVTLFADYDRGHERARAALPARRRFPEPALHVDSFVPVAAGIAFGAVAGSADLMMDDEDDGFMLEEVAAAEAPEPAPAMAPPPQMKAAAAPMRSASRKRKKGGRPPRPQKKQPGAGPIGGLEPEGAAPTIAFRRLRLGSPRSGHRAVLRAADPLDDYRALLERSGLRPPSDLAGILREAAAGAARAAQLPLPDDTVEVGAASGQFDYTYTADDRIDVPSDLAFHSIPLGSRTAECTVTYVVVPRVDVNVFRVASVRNPTDAPLLIGPAEVYVGGEYVLSTILPMVAPEAQFELGLGVEQALRCVRNTRYKEARSGKNVVAMAELHHEIDIELHNPLSRAIRCEVRERVPQPAKDAEVDVEEVAIEPPWEEWDQVELGRKLTGGRRWKIEVDARDKAELKAHYVVKIYANNEVVGGNRREA